MASLANFKEILTELGCYVTDVDKELGKEAIRVIGRIAIRVPPSSPQALELLLGCLELEQVHSLNFFFLIDLFWATAPSNKSI